MIHLLTKAHLQFCNWMELLLQICHRLAEQLDSDRYSHLLLAT